MLQPSPQIQQIKPFSTQELVYFLSATVVYFYSALDTRARIPSIPARIANQDDRISRNTGFAPVIEFEGYGVRRSWSLQLGVVKSACVEIRSRFTMMPCEFPGKCAV
jgi:hypothetical protein